MAATAGHGFPGCWRLREAGEFKAVFSRRRLLRGAWFDLHYRPNAGTSARLGLVIAKKLARRAVLRNAARRVTREAFRHVRAQLPAMDLVVRLAKPLSSVESAAKRAWRGDIDKLLARLTALEST